MRRRTTLAAIAAATLSLIPTTARATSPDFADVLARVIDRDPPAAHRIDPWAVAEDEATPRPIDGWARPDVISPARRAALALERIRERAERAEQLARRARREAAAEASTPTTVQGPTMPEGSLERLICSYDWDCPTALRVAGCESHMDPLAGFDTMQTYRGLWQNYLEASTDPAVQTRHAWEKYAASGYDWGPWGWPNGDFGCAFG